MVVMDLSWQNYLRKKGYKVDVFCLQKKYYKGDALKALNQLQIKSQKYFRSKNKKKISHNRLFIWNWN